MEKYRNSSLTIEERVEDLLSNMTIREKAGQLNQRMFGWKAYKKIDSRYEITDAFKEEVAAGDGVGALYGLFRADSWSQVGFENGIPARESAVVCNMLQKYAVENTRLGIPLLFTEECPHGHMALEGIMFPTNLGIGSTWNCLLYEEAFSLAAAEIRAKGGNIALVSALDILQDPRWGRSEECYGEDPHLSACMASAVTRGLQGDGGEDLKKQDRVAAVLKHFCAQGAALGGHNGKSAIIGERELREIHLPAMKAAVQAGAAGCMAAYNDIDGVYCHANQKLLTDILRNEWGFKGIVMSDGCAVDNLRSVAGSDEEAVGLAVGAGVDLNLWSDCYKNLEKAVKVGILDEKLVDIAVRRVLTLKFKLGLFDKPYINEEKADFYNSLLEKGRRINLKLAQEAIVLIKNEDNVLPIRKNIKKIAVIGPNADNLYNQLGDYTPPQLDGTGQTLLQGMLGAAGKDFDIVHAKGCGIRDASRTDFTKAIEAAESADLIVLALGGSSARDFNTKFDKNGAAIVSDVKYDKDEMDCGEGADIAGLEPGGVQIELLEAVEAIGKPVIVIMIQGRPYAIERILAKCKALLCAWYPGKEGGRAVADILFGRECPSGRLPVSLPRSSAQLPVYYNHRETSDYIDMSSSPLFPFGFGLSYTIFNFSNLKLTYGSAVYNEMDNAGLELRVPAEEFENGSYVEVTIDINNAGKVRGAEVVQLYISGFGAGICRRNKELKGFQKVWLDPGSQTRLTFKLGKAELGIWDMNMNFNVVPGKVNIQLGSDSSKGCKAEFIII